MLFTFTDTTVVERVAYVPPAAHITSQVHDDVVHVREPDVQAGGAAAAVADVHLAEAVRDNPPRRPWHGRRATRQALRCTTLRKHKRPPCPRVRPTQG